MKKAQVQLIPLQDDDREQFIKDNQRAFKYGAMEEFGLRNDQFEEEDEIISRRTIEDSIDKGEAYRIVCDGEKAGGAVIHTDGARGELDLLFTLPEAHSKGIGYAAWCEIERLHPEVEVWETVTPYFETRNIHFYVNKCGFHIVEFYNPFHRDPRCHDDAECEEEYSEDDGPDPSSGDFRFEKRMR
ncbi:MAG: GNAT family N-acetyltransferase [Firmicutes bacterium]|nr:GNAT family N-acetyltransferase [Bacillota bacterium]